ncbi:phosphatidylserine synthase isoform X1 [Bactrocera dorsalis]|uniref:Phosphatidylserine synthase n=2 Tax=Bactrocera dorsalis TaxID=27457 RepID=A0A6I9V7V3_BACDO|nr:phosphatidylserine synthase isoform X1 [Bactrocera dorsalis]XP_019846204.2 phosphatidylserine synthase isoform X1 [Bactrocera dorsalis]
MKKRMGGSDGNSSADESGAESQSATNSNVASAKSSKPRNSSSISKDKGLDEYAETFVIVNERPVDDISLDFFYKPHTITLFAISVLCMMFFAYVRNETNIEDNIWAGILCAVFFFLIISLLAFPNGPFTRPHPAVWRIIFGCSVLYLLMLQFFMFQNYKTIMNIFYWLDPKLEHFHINMEKEYGANCSDLSFDRIYSTIDVFAWGHFLGWAFKAVLIRHAGILWAISVMWEITEITFAHLLPNFVECWWDALILDVLICNGLGIWVGLRICKALEMREYKWASIKDISTTTGKLKRVVLQFTPESFTSIRWLDPKSTAMRFAAVCQLVIFWQVTELNTFFLKHIFEMPPDHYLVVGRLVFIGLVVAPSVRQYYTYVTDTRCKRVGTQCWVYGAIMVSEAILCLKNGKELFERTQGINIVLWLITQVILSVAFVYGCMLWHRAQDKYNKSTESPSKKGKAQNADNSPKHEQKGKKSPKKSPKRNVQKVE